MFEKMILCFIGMSYSLTSLIRISLIQKSLYLKLLFILLGKSPYFGTNKNLIQSVFILKFYLYNPSFELKITSIVRSVVD